MSPVANLPTAKLLAPIAAGAMLICALIGGLLLWSSNQVDRVARNRDGAIVSLVLKQSLERVAHSQESSTVWDDAVRKLRQRPLDLDWLDVNLGTWFYSYAGHDEVYVLDRANAPVYAMREGSRADPFAYDEVRPQVAPLVAELRTRTDITPRGDHDFTMLAPGVADLATIRNRPAIVSLKPIVTDTGALVQRPGTEAVHVSVVYLDKTFIGRLGRQYGLKGGRYSPTASTEAGEASIPLRKRDGNPVGYFVWRPFSPGYEVAHKVAPLLIIGSAFAGLVVCFLAWRLSRKTMDLDLSRAQAQHLALHDVLTGLPNRLMFERRLSQALTRCRRDNARLALLYIDLDRFKSVNDTLGHPAGDALIREVARRLTAQLRPGDAVARIGGDEFAIIQHDADRPASTADRCEQIIKAIGQPFDLMGAQSFVGASIGVAFAPEDGQDLPELTRKADIALYKAKLAGRGRHILFRPSMDHAIRERDRIVRDLRAAIADGEKQFRVHYQPIYAASTGRITAVEALLRWCHPTRGLVNPSDFIGFAEDSGLIEALGDWVLRTALRDARPWSGVRLCVNVSPVQIRSDPFVDRVIELLAESGLERERLELEITETALMDSSPEVRVALQRLRHARVGIALDDFGTGYSSLSHIRDLAVDRIKIDRTFVSAIQTGHGAALVQAIVMLAQANGLRLTAEGVETQAQHDLLRDLGCEEFQGYFLSRPVTATTVSAFLESEKQAGSLQSCSQAA